MTGSTFRGFYDDGSEEPRFNGLPACSGRWENALQTSLIRGMMRPNKRKE